MFSLVIFFNSLICQQSAPQARNCFFFAKKNEYNFVSLVKILKKKSQEEINKTNQKKLRFQSMAVTMKESII